MPRPSVCCIALSLLTAAACAPGCAGAPVADAPASIRIVCAPRADPVQCLGPASDRCGPDGYDLFDARGRPATLADARYGPLEARCRR